MRRLHFARATILAQIPRFGKDVVPLLGFLIGNGLNLIGPQFMHCLPKYWSLRCGRIFVEGVFHKYFLVCLLGDLQILLRKPLLRRAAETEAIIRFQPAERGGLIRVQSKPVTLLNKMIALLRIFYRAGGFHII